MRHSYDEYTLADLDPKTLEVDKRKLADILNGKVAFEVQTGSELDYPDNTFERLVATHILERIYQPHSTLKEWRKVLKHGGSISILIPTDSGVSWVLGRYFGPRKNAIAQGIAYKNMMANSMLTIVTILLKICAIISLKNNSGGRSRFL